MQTVKKGKQLLHILYDTAKNSFSLFASSPNQKMSQQKSKENLERDKRHAYQAASIYHLSEQYLDSLCISTRFLSELRFIFVCCLSLTE